MCVFKWVTRNPYNLLFYLGKSAIQILGSPVTYFAPEFSCCFTIPYTTAGVRNVCIILHRMIFLLAPTGVKRFLLSGSVV